MLACAGLFFDCFLHTKKGRRPNGYFPLMRQPLLCCYDKVGIGESNPGGHERKVGAPVKLRTASGPQATDRRAKEEACERSEAGGQSPMGHQI